MEKIGLITGANSGIGKATATALAAQDASIVMICRDRGKGEAARAEICRKTGNERVDLLIVDLSQQSEIRGVAREVRAKYPKLHVLINNAGAWNSDRLMTPDGFETTWAVNHLAYFLLTMELLDLLKASVPARIVNLSSDWHKLGHINFDDLQFEHGYGGSKAYGQSKLANIIFTYELARRLQGTGITVNCLHPGGVNTNFFTGLKGLTGIITRLNRPLMRSPEKGAETVIWLATSSEVEGITGKYFFDCHEIKSSRESYDPEIARKLWEISERMTNGRI
jgi:NAD(P)-dependent dehydrogenase (short-subunit alcohol dehydrogenase family)